LGRHRWRSNQRKIRGNPFEQCEDKQFSVKALLADHDQELRKLWLYYLIVLTRGKLNWTRSDVKKKSQLKNQVAEIGDIAAKVKLISPNRNKSLDHFTVRKVVEALKGPKLPENLIRSFEFWGQDYERPKRGQTGVGPISPQDPDRARKHTVESFFTENNYTTPIRTVRWYWTRISTVI
jgi:hypothetical protein